MIRNFINFQNKKFRYAILIVVTVWVLFHLFHGLFFKRREHKILVQAVQAVNRDIPVTITAPGSVESIQSVAITPQVTGTITKVDFQPGQNVTAGQVLFEIDPTSLAASLQQTQAVLQRDQVELLQNQADAKRYAELVKHEYVTRQQSDQAATVAKAQQALVDSDKAQVMAAQAQLSHTKITAPVSGKTGNSQVRVGDVVTAESATPLVTINPLNPISVDFSLPQTNLGALIQNQKTSPLTVNIFSEDGNQKLTTAKLNFIDNTVNNQTGTVLIKAIADNSAEMLWPGEMVSVQIVLSDDPNAITIPMNAVQIDELGDYVYVVEKNKVHVQRVTLKRQANDMAVIATGLTKGTEVLSVIPPNFSPDEPLTIQLTG